MEVARESKSPNRLVFQVLVLSMATLVLVVADSRRVRAVSLCDMGAAACASHCGTTVTWHGTYYQFYNPYCDFDTQTQQWIPCMDTAENYTLGPGVANYECDEGNPGDAICACVY